MLYFAEKLSPNMARSAEGYLICRNVPVARVGVQEYLTGELGLPFSPHRVPVHRLPEEVFSPACIASFEGKPVTEDHPADPEGVTAENIHRLQKGHAQNIRRGEGPDSNLLLADLVITDPGVIRRILAGKREISCGYTYTLTQENGRWIQREIRGNHIAVVDHGRAGPRVAIRDHRPPCKKERSTHPMKKSVQKTVSPAASSPLIRKLVASAIRGNDLSPEELPEVLALMEAAAPAEEAPAAPAEVNLEVNVEAAPAEEAPAAPAEETLAAGDGEAEILARLDRIIALLETRPLSEAAAPAEAPLPAGSDEDPLAQAAAGLSPADLLPEEDPEEALKEDLAAALREAGEAGVTPSGYLSAEAEAAEETALAEEARAGEETREAADALVRSAVRALRPVIARLPRAQQASAADAALRALKAHAAPARRRTGDGRAYAALARSARPAADPGELGRRIIASRNINMKKG